MRLKDKAKVLAPKLPMMLLTLCIAILIGVTTKGIGYAMSKQVSIVDENGEYTITTLAKTTAEVLADNNIVLKEHDEVNMALDQKIKDNDKIVVARAKKVTVNDATTEIVKITTANTVAQLLKELDITLDGAEMDKKLDEKLTDNMNVAITRYKEEMVTEDVVVPFATTTKTSTSLKDGDKKVAVEGKNGLNQKVFKVSYTNGVETGRELVNTVEVEKPVNKVMEVGKSSGYVASARPGTVTSRSGNMRYRKVLDVSCVAYTLASSGTPTTSKYYGLTASGMKARRGVVAVDPRVIPLGTRLYIEGANGSWSYGEAIAGDTGGGVKGNTVDLFMDTLAECYQFGRRPAKVYILE